MSDFDPREASVGKDNDFEGIIRPQELSDFTGQKEIVSNLKVYIQAARKREEALDHTLFHGPPGLGKTTLAHIIANEMGVNLKVTSGPVLAKPRQGTGGEIGEDFGRAVHPRRSDYKERTPYRPAPRKVRYNLRP